MKPMLFILLTGFCLYGCHQQTQATRQQLEGRIDSLQKAIDRSYKPGLGEFMSGIQLHHEKLWFAGKAQNWELADFEIHEIKEALTDIYSYCNDRPETRFLSMINPPLDSLNRAIGEKNGASFQKHYIVLTNTCNSCHQTTQHGFNVIKVPDVPVSSFSNQEFNVHKKAGK